MTLKDDVEKLGEAERKFWLALVKALRIEELLRFLTRVLEKVNEVESGALWAGLGIGILLAIAVAIGVLGVMAGSNG